MPSYLHDFFFDTNFGFGEESVFTLFDQVGQPSPPPPIEGYLLETDGTPLLLTTGAFLALA